MIFILIEAINGISERLLRGSEEEEAPKEAATKVCPFCYSEIAILASRCPFCTSVLEENKVS